MERILCIVKNPFDDLEEVDTTSISRRSPRIRRKLLEKSECNRN